MKKFLCVLLSMLLCLFLCFGTSAYYPMGTNYLMKPGSILTELARDGVFVVPKSDKLQQRIPFAQSKNNPLVIYSNIVFESFSPSQEATVIREITMYAPDGRTLQIPETERTAYENVGWYSEPVMTVYAVDGRTLDIYKRELDAYLQVGWYKSPSDFPLSQATKMVALTFDDGPSKHTTRILDCLEKYNAKATFFVVGNSVTAYPSIVKRAHDMGMEIGNHTMTHKNLKTLGADGVRKELNAGATTILNATNVKPALIRPPYGNYNSTVSSVANAPLILWCIDTLDWKTRNADKTVASILNNVKDGDIILMHDLYSQSADAAIRVIPELISRGYRLVTVSEMAKAKGISLQNGKAYGSIR